MRLLYSAITKLFFLVLYKFSSPKINYLTIEKFIFCKLINIKILLIYTNNRLKIRARIIWLLQLKEILNQLYPIKSNSNIY